MLLLFVLVETTIVKWNGWLAGWLANLLATGPPMWDTIVSCACIPVPSARSHAEILLRATLTRQDGWGGGGRGGWTAVRPRIGGVCMHSVWVV